MVEWVGLVAAAAAAAEEGVGLVAVGAESADFAVGLSDWQAESFEPIAAAAHLTAMRNQIINSLILESMMKNLSSKYFNT